MQLKDYINVLKKRWWLALLVAVIAAGVAFGYSLSQPKTYQAIAKLQGDVGKPDNNLWASLKEQINGYTARFDSVEFAAAINERGKFDLPIDEIRGKIKVQARPAEYTFVITVEDTDAKRAASIANTSGQILVDENEQKIAGYNQDQQTYIKLTSPAATPDKPNSPRTNLNTAAGAALGLVIGLIFIFAVEFFDDTIKSEEELKRLTGLTVLGSVPIWKGTASQSLPMNSATEAAEKSSSPVKIGSKRE
ncbi:Wzz/FepE/Etk N-terminal domain-containing protein [Candidatus Chlorohelix sp.]|uniref:YveK family protein n=1 Tax=Candidatus Chlorohelix sp. TaxID=3139201 RepID=UPI00302AEED3